MTSKLNFLLAATACGVVYGGRPDASRASSFEEAAAEYRRQVELKAKESGTAETEEVADADGNQRSLLSTRTEVDGEGGEPAKRLGGFQNKLQAKEGEQACYNELTVVGDVNEDGAFSPQEWFDMFVKMDSVSHQVNWKLSEDEWRMFVPNCDFGCFQELVQSDPDENLDWYEWKNAMKLLDKQGQIEQNADDPDFLLEKAELDCAGLAGYARGSNGDKATGTCKKLEAGCGGGDDKPQDPDDDLSEEFKILKEAISGGKTGDDLKAICDAVPDDQIENVKSKDSAAAEKCKEAGATKFPA